MPNTPEYRRAYYRRNPKKFKAYQRRYRARVRRWYQANKVRISAKRRVWNQNARLELVRLLGGKCKHCAITDIRILHVDHKKNNGNTQRRQFGSGGAFRKILKDVQAGSKDYQLLCANHNWLRRYE